MTTPYYAFALANSSNQMSDVDTFFNDNFGKIKASVKSPVHTSLPFSSAENPYVLGDTIYLDSSNSLVNGLYVCVMNDPVWGYLWWPATSAYSPWRRPGVLANPNSVLLDTNHAIDDSDSPFQFRLTNRGVLHFRGAILKSPAGPMIDYGVSGNLTLLKTLPQEIRPPARMSFDLGMYPISSTAANNGQYGQHYARADGTSFQRFFNPGASATRCFWNKVAYYIGNDITF